MSKVQIFPSKELVFGEVAKKIIYLLIPESVEIIKTTLKITGDVFTGNAASTEIGTTISPSPEEGKTTVATDSVTVDFHITRTIDGLDLSDLSDSSDKRLPKGITSDGKGPHCIMRLWGGSQWYLPSPKNLFKISTNSFSGKFPKVSASKVLLSFCKLNTTTAGTAGYIDLTASGYTAVDDLLELAGFEKLKSIEEPVPITISPNKIVLNSYDYLTNLSFQVGDFSPFWLEPKEFAAPDDKPIELPDFSTDLNNYLKAAKPTKSEEITIEGLILPPGKSYFEVPITIQTNTSGVLGLKEFNIDYLIHHTEEEKQISFDWNEERTGVTSGKIEVNIPAGATVKYISFDLQGSLAKERLVADITPQPGNGFSNFGLLLEKGKAIAQKISFTQKFNIFGFDLRLNPISDTVKYKLELRLDKENTPTGEIVASKAIEYQADDKTKNTYSWFKIDLEQPIEATENQNYWLVLTGEEGEIIWQMNFFEETETFGYSFQEGIWKHLETYQGKPVGGIFRVYHLPDEFSTPPAVEFKGIWNLTTDPTTIDSKVEVETNSSIPEVEVQAQSQGTLTIKNLLVKYQESPLPTIVKYMKIPSTSQLEESKPLDFLLDKAPLTIIDGIGDEFSKKLKSAGISSIGKLAEFDFSTKPPLPLETMKEFVAKANLIKKIVERTPKVPLPLGASFERIREMSDTQLNEITNGDSQLAKRIKEDFNSLSILTDKSDIKNACLSQYF